MIGLVFGLMSLFAFGCAGWLMDKMAVGRLRPLLLWRIAVAILFLAGAGLLMQSIRNAPVLHSGECRALLGTPAAEGKKLPDLSLSEAPLVSDGMAEPVSAI